MFEFDGNQTAVVKTLEGLAGSAVWSIGWSIPFLGWLISVIVVPPVTGVLWLLLLFKAYQGERFKLPIAGEIAEARA